MKGVGAGVRALRYRVEVFESTLDWSHGHGRKITEYFVPCERLGFNLVEGQFNVFRCRGPRCDRGTEVAEVRLPAGFVSGLREIAGLRERLTRQFGKGFRRGGAVPKGGRRP